LRSYSIFHFNLFPQLEQKLLSPPTGDPQEGQKFISCTGAVTNGRVTSFSVPESGTFRYFNISLSIRSSRESSFALDLAAAVATSG
jgi:hypothetical protein